MNLTLDIGNTHAKAALFLGTKLVDVALHVEAIRSLMANKEIERAIVCKSGVNEVLEEELERRRIPVLQLSAQTKLPIALTYQTPETLGADRIAGSVAAKHLFPQHPVLKIDFGTCITYDFINAKGAFEGGAISPGATMRFQAMHHYTARLPLVDPVQLYRVDLIGNDTVQALLSGVVNGIKNEVEGVIKEYQLRFAGLKTVATGGDSGFFVTLLKSEIFARPYLVLEGLNTILNFNT